MIEVEKKFSPTVKQLKKLLLGAIFLEEITFSDTYFDTNEYLLILSDKWLRMRDGKLELKLPLGPIEHTGKSLDLYNEVINETQIRKILNLSKSEEISKALKNRGYRAVCKFKTIRKKYKKNGFNIDVDEVDFGYNLAEIEVLVTNSADINKASLKIIDFAKDNGLTVKYVRGKFVEYVFRYNKKLYNLMKQAGFFPSKK